MDADRADDAVGNLDYQQTRLGAAVKLTADYVYDANDRLLTEIVDDVVDSNDRHLAYEYGPASAGTQLTQRSVRQGQTSAGLLLERATYAYNLQGRLRQALIDSTGDGAIDSASQYEYADDGVRTSRTVQGVTTLDLVDANNPTGFAQVLEERTGAAPTPASPPTRSYTLGLDVIAQADSAAAPRLLVYDGHGSTRLLVDPASTANFVVQAYAYDAYGQMLVGAGLTGASSAAATLLYSGEQTDRATGLQYLRARYYDPRSGRFATLDPYAGDPAAPQSLHKYLYVHANPVLGVDPSGESEFTVPGVGVTISINTSVSATSFSTFAGFQVFVQQIAFDISSNLPQIGYLYDLFGTVLALSLLGIDAIEDGYRNPHAGTNVAIEAYEVSTWEDLNRRARQNGQAGDFVYHHVPQKAEAHKLLGGAFEPPPSKSEPSIAIPRSEHSSITRAQFTNDLDRIVSATDRAKLLPRDFFHLRKYTAAPISNLSNLASMIRGKYPALFGPRR